ncbi:A disintegrin and metalloproteinase with thrombospondin motifs 7 isoform X2 [Megachile rotundata]|uniref:A disintegrin and metalloproteinase with thrombospondin motifs 7 isoform X2 n=1 Tax=Megachile rotundata TaxID=143995 RepID=UPI0006151F0E|nr:PREDICTED: A disintegrin and metalloproteinase with thrombospondin motifs 7-like isoform X3 [Megachile rotundata]
MRYSLVLQAFIVVVHIVPEARLHRPSNVRGIYTLEKHVHGHEIVIPRKVTHLGELISHNVTHHHHEDGPVVHYRLSVAGNEYHIELTAVENFIGAGMVVERRKRDVHVRSRPKNRSSKCHYRGFIQGHTNSQVALSACDGLAGMLRGDNGEFWLEPVAVSPEEERVGLEERLEEDAGAEGRSLDGVHRNSLVGRPHLVFRRSIEQPQLEIGAAGGTRRRRKKKRKLERNCGTREPRRLTETRLEWQTQPGLVQVQGRGRRKQHQTKRWQRTRRSISRPRHVEALVVADTTMMAFHQDGDVETYLLTIMNMVSSLYLDPTIGNFINVVVVRIILVEEDEAEQGLDITVNADRTLYNFCKWQQKLNPADDSHPNHHDVAILVTREDICSRANTPCSTLGVAHVAGMCQPDRSCSVNEDNGITLAHTITHELGHNFGMYHDTEKIGCSKRDGDTLHVMTPTFEVDTIGVAWSRCSRRDITNFLEKSRFLNKVAIDLKENHQRVNHQEQDRSFSQGKGVCLEDEPADNDYAYPDLPPGAMYNAEHQCRLQFGVREASVCSPLQEICSKLWCIVDGTCTTMLHPAAPGTHCGKHMWCQNQECVPIVDRPRQIDGGWGEWGSWSECSRSCGAGVSIVERKCDHPEPAHGGKFCIGERRRYKICNTHPCPEGTASFRAIQCSNYDGKEYKGKNYTWLPYFDQTEPCELYCTDTEESVIVPWGEAALDGTPCNVGTRDMCIAGICRKVGCDWTVDSDATEDRCGICHGDGTQCETTGGVYDKNDGPGYKEVVVVPSGSRNIKIEEIGNSKNYIGLGVPNSDKYFLNGKRQITLAGEYEVAGTPALYERDRDREKVRIPGPIREDIAVYLISRGYYRNFGLRYEYTVPKKEPDRAPEYSWLFSDWSLCTATCGGGTQTSKAVCNEKKSGIVEDHFCDGIEKPESILRECNLNPCPARWWIGPWQMCPVTCGEGALRKRSVMCVSSGMGPDRSDLALPDRDCNRDVRPEEVGPCPNLPLCSSTEPPLIVYADNKDASFYNVSSNDQDGITIVDGLTTEEPEILEFDNVVDENPDNSMYNTKSKWIVSKWSHCTNGKRSRKVSCSVQGDCTLENKPISVELCQGGRWVTGRWGFCNATCLVRIGIKRREVECRDRITELLSNDCNLERRPIETRRCYHRKQCTNDKSECKDTIVPASMCATYKRMCHVSSIVQEKCCATCSKKRRHGRHNRRHLGD